MIGLHNVSEVNMLCRKESQTLGIPTHNNTFKFSTSLLYSLPYVLSILVVFCAKLLSLGSCNDINNVSEYKSGMLEYFKNGIIDYYCVVDPDLE